MIRERFRCRGCVVVILSLFLVLLLLLYLLVKLLNLLFHLLGGFLVTFPLLNPSFVRVFHCLILSNLLPSLFFLLLLKLKGIKLFVRLGCLSVKSRLKNIVHKCSFLDLNCLRIWSVIRAHLYKGLCNMLRLFGCRIGTRL